MRHTFLVVTVKKWLKSRVAVDMYSVSQKKSPPKGS